MRAWLWVWAVVWSVGGCEGVWLETYRSGVWKVPEDTMHALQLSLRFNTSDLTGWETEEDEAQLEVLVVPDEDWKLNFVNTSVQFSGAEVREEVNKSLVFSGYYWGRTHLSFYLTRDDLHPGANVTLLRDDLEITVDRKSVVLDISFIAIGTVFVLINNVNMGAQLDLVIIKSVLKRPLGPVCGFVSQFVVMPVATFVMGSILFTDPLHRLGLFILGCCPGGTSSNFWTLMFNGDINLSITMTAVSTIAAMGMMPLWLFTLGKKLLESNANLKIPFGNLASSLVVLTIPISIGIFIRKKRPSWAEWGAKIIKPFSFFILVFFMAVGSYNSYKVVLMMTWQMVVAGLLVVTSGYTFGAVFAKLVCLPRKQIIAVSIETALQNPGVAFVLLKLSLESPYSDLASIPIIATLFVTGPPLIFTYLIYASLRRFCGCCPDRPQQDTPPPKDQEAATELMSASNPPDTKVVPN